jgi:two-component system LytT family sensor kinase
MKNEQRIILLHLTMLTGIIGLTIFLLPPPHHLLTLSAKELSCSVILHNLLAAGGYYLNYFVFIPFFDHRKRPFYFTLLMLYAFISLYVPFLLNLLFIWWRLDFKLIDLIRFPLPHLMLLSGAYMLSYILRRRYEWKQLLQEKAAFELSKKTMEITTLKHQIQPHFFFNTLNGIYGLAIKQSDKTPSAILRLADMMRYVLYESDTDKVSLSREITHIENYIQMQLLRLSPYNQVELIIDRSANNFQIAPFLFMPFVENNFKYGISTNESTDMKITIYNTERSLHFKSVNTIVIGPKVPLQEGVGIRNVKRRLELIYPDQYSLEIKQQDHTFIVNLSIHL